MTEINSDVFIRLRRVTAEGGDQIEVAALRSPDGDAKTQLFAGWLVAGMDSLLEQFVAQLADAESPPERTILLS